MKKIEITEIILFLLKSKSIPYSELYSDHFSHIRNSEFATCIKDLKNEKFVDYDGNFNDNVDIVLTRYGEEQLFKHKTYKKHLESKSAETRFDRVVKWGKNNIAIVIIMLVVAAGGALIAFKDAINKSFFSSNDSIQKNISANPIDTQKHGSFLQELVKQIQPKDSATNKESSNPQKQSGTDKQKEDKKNKNPITQQGAEPIWLTFCDKVKYIATDINIAKGTLKEEGKWSSKIPLAGEIFSEITNEPNLIVFKSTFYDGTDKGKADSIYTDLKGRINCISPLRDVPHPQGRYCEVDSRDLDIRIIWLAYSDLKGTQKYSVSVRMINFEKRN